MNFQQEIMPQDVASVVMSIKKAIQQTRYNMMRKANGEALALYYSVGGYIAERTAVAQWGDKVLEAISVQLQQKCPDYVDSLLVTSRKCADSTMNGNRYSGKLRLNLQLVR